MSSTQAGKNGKPNGSIATAPDPLDSLLPPGTNCSVVEGPMGDAIILFRVTDAVTLSRLKRRAGTQDLSMHVWENLLKRAISAYVF